MAKEIERKFLIAHVPIPVLEQRQGELILQGYITDNPNTQQVRLRSKGDKYYLTVKGRGNLEREETEIEMSVEQFEALWPLTAGRRIRKQRYEIPYHEHTIELDMFEGDLNSLIMAEIEFDSVEQSSELKIPTWFGEEVTYDHRYTNSQLANNGKLP